MALLCGMLFQHQNSSSTHAEQRQTASLQHNRKTIVQTQKLPLRSLNHSSVKTETNPQTSKPRNPQSSTQAEFTEGYKTKNALENTLHQRFLLSARSFFALVHVRYIL
jgi:hypothetical protein